MIATSIEQSKHLLELGLDPKTADMFWKYSASLGNKDINGRIAVSYHDNLFVGKYDGAIPAWSLDALLDTLGDSQLVVWCLNKLIMNNGYHLTTDSPVGGKTYTGKTKIEAVYNAVCDMLERRTR